jgi:photosystem II stability/assembly factor-like uncharacterized protein
MKQIFLCAGLLLLSLQVVYSQTTWINHLTGGTDNLNGVGVYTSTQWTAVGAGGAIWHTTNSGATWTSQNSTTQMPLHDVFCVSGAAAFAVGDSGIILRTSTSGNTWVRQTSGTIMPIQSVYFRTSQIGYACGWAGNIFSTTNSGATWSMQSVSLTANFNDITFVSSSTGYCVGLSGVIYKTTNGGISWAPQTSGVNVNLNEVHFLDSLNGYCAGGNGTLLKTTDGGLNWNQVSPFSTDNFESMCFITPLLGFCGTDAGDIFFSTDGGNNWLPLPSNSVSVNEIEFVSNQKCIAACNLGYVLESTYLDWIGHPNTSYCDLIKFINDSVGFAVNNQYGYFLKTTNAGQTWNVCYTPAILGCGDIDFVDDSIGYVTAWQLLYKTVDQGNTWTAIPQTSQHNRIDFITEQIGYGDFGSMARTTDGGISWVALGDNHAYDPYFFDVDTGYARSNQGLRFTDDGGNTWVSHPVPTGLSGMHVLNKNIVYIWNDGYASNINSELYRTYDAGNTFTQIILPYQGNSNYVLEDAFFTDSLTGYIAMDFTPFYDLFIYKTIDGGTTWALQGIEYGVSGGTTFEFANKNKGFCTSAQGIMRNVNSDPIVGIADPPFNYNVYVRQPAPPYSWIIEPGDSAQLNMTDSRDAHFCGTETDYAGHLVFSGEFNDKCEVASFVMDSPYDGPAIFVGRCREDRFVDWVVPFYLSTTGAEPLSLTSISSNSLNQVLVAGMFSGTLIVGNITLTALTPGNFMIKLDSTGNVLWAKAFTPNVTTTNHFFHAEFDAQGNIFFTGNYSGVYYMMQTIWLWATGHCYIGKFSPQGTLLWCVQSSDNKDTRGVSCNATPDGGVIVCGLYQGKCKFGYDSISAADSNDIFIVKYAAGGYLEWIVRANGPGYEFPVDIDCDATGNFYLVGTFESSCRFDSTYVVTTYNNTPAIFYAKYDDQGNFEWVYKLSGLVKPALSVSSLGDCYLTGSINAPYRFADTTITPVGTSEIIVLKTGTDGKIRWVQRIGGQTSLISQENLATGIASTATGNCYITGKVWGYDIDTIGTYQTSTGSTTNAAYYGFFAKIGYGQIYSNVFENQSQTLGWVNVFPVPASESIQCDWFNSTGESYQIEVYDMTGSLVSSQTGNPTGFNTINTNELKAGVYSIKLVTIDSFYTTRFIISH